MTCEDADMKGNICSGQRESIEERYRAHKGALAQGKMMLDSKQSA